MHKSEKDFIRKSATEIEKRSAGLASWILRVFLIQLPIYVIYLLECISSGGDTTNSFGRGMLSFYGLADLIYLYNRDLCYTRSFVWFSPLIGMVMYSILLSLILHTFIKRGIGDAA